MQVTDTVFGDGRERRSGICATAPSGTEPDEATLSVGWSTTS
jgi:hypothetical protein